MTEKQSRRDYRRRFGLMIFSEIAASKLSKAGQAQNRSP